MLLTIWHKTLLAARKGLAFTLGLALSVAATANTLEDISFASLPGDRFEVKMRFSEVPPTPEDYSIEQPARIVMDFPGVDNSLAERRYPLSMPNAESAMILAGDGRTRLILNLKELAGYQSRIEGNFFIVEVGRSNSQASGEQQAQPIVEQGSTTTVSTQSSRASNTSRSTNTSGPTINGIDFRRGESGEGRIVVSLSAPNINIDLQQARGLIEVTFDGVRIPTELANRYDVVDFATPVRLVDAENERNGAVIRIDATGEYDYLAYQTNNEYVIAVKPLTKSEVEEKAKQFQYVGERVSLNFQDIPIRSVLQIIADMTDLNLVTSDTVTGNIALRLDKVPWDQALDLVLKTKGLDKRQIGNVLMVAPAAEIAERERQELETQKQLEELAPLRTEYVRIRYANARALFDLFNTQDSAGGSGGGSGQGSSTGSILSERGQAIVDERTNSIILTDTQEKINQFRQLVEQIDIPIRQVMIEARIVVANARFSEQMGVRWGGIGARARGNSIGEFSGSLEGLDSTPGDPAGFFGGGGTTDWRENLMVDLGISGPAGSFAVNFISSSVFLDLELSALEESGDAEIVSQPKIITGDKKEAEIISGSEIPYTEESASGGTTVSFKEAVLRLKVTPQITPDNNIIMDLEIASDSVGDIIDVDGNSLPILDVAKLATQVLVANGETIVLGGVYQTETQTSETKVPFLGDLPYLGKLFRNNVKRDEKKELLIFITPRIMAENLAK